MKKVILVTGASSGIGKATTLQLIDEGHTVYGAARRVDKMQDIVTAGGKAIAMDVTKEAEVENGVNQIIAEQGRIDVLVNNAGYAVYGPLEEVSLEDARRQFEVNIFGLASITQKVIPHMRKESYGKIINISSIGGKVYTPFGGWYHATKHALEGWSDSLRMELEEFGIDVVIIQPGLIKTEFADVLYDPMIERAKNTVYEDKTKLMAKATLKAFNDPKSYSPPRVIASEISKAIHSKKPKTRYSAGKMAKMLLTMRKLVSDRMFDRLVMLQVKNL